MYTIYELYLLGRGLPYSIISNKSGSQAQIHTPSCGPELELDLRGTEIKAHYLFPDECSPPAQDHYHCLKAVFLMDALEHRWSWDNTPLLPHASPSNKVYTYIETPLLHQNLHQRAHSYPESGHIYTKQHSISVDMHEEFQWKHFQLAALAQVKNSMSPACFHLRNPSQPLDLRYLILLSHSHFPQLFIPHCSSHVILHLPI